MKFGQTPLSEAEGALLVHAVRLPDRWLRKGVVLGEEDLQAMARAGIKQVLVARPEPDELGENTAAEALGKAGAGPYISASKAFAGRVNLLAEQAGVLEVDAQAINGFNRIDPAITVATLPAYARVDRGQLLATIKIIPYAAKRAFITRAAERISGALRLHPVQNKRISLILSTGEGLKPSLLEKGRKAIGARLARLGLGLAEHRIVPHEAQALAAAISEARGDIVLLLGAFATADIRDTGPEAVRRAGGRISRFGIPVDPGNLLFVGEQGGRPVLGLPGCVRALALNGADWVLERMICGIELDEAMLTGMGVGGLLKEIPTRPMPRRMGDKPGADKFAVILLAAGQSRRMRGQDKLLQEVGGGAMLRHAAISALESAASEVLVVLPPAHGARRAALKGLAVRIIDAPDHAEGMGASLRNAMGRIGADIEGVIVALADMPEVAPVHFDSLISGYDPARGHEICRACDEAGRPGHPILFGRRFFESLSASAGDIGGRDILRDSAEFVLRVPTSGRGASLDLDTPEAWAGWRGEAG